MERSDKEKEFIELISNHKGILYKVINIYCKDKEERFDLEQEIIIQLWKSYKNYNPNYHISTFIYRIALNVAISYFRKDMKRKQRNTFYNESIFEIGTGFEEEQTKSEELKILYLFIDELDRMNKALLILHLDGKSYKEISVLLGISESNVGTKLNRIRQTLIGKFTQIYK